MALALGARRPDPTAELGMEILEEWNRTKQESR
jgi:hypothetical protein